jgi:hypothetical protein
MVADVNYTCIGVGGMKLLECTVGALGEQRWIGILTGQPLLNG